MQTLRGDYFSAYHNLKLTRDANGVLVAEFHNNGGPFIMGAQAHTEFVDAFYRIGQDRANKIVILTGAGGEFITDVDWSSFGDVADPGVWSQVHDEGLQVPKSFVVEVPSRRFCRHRTRQSSAEAVSKLICRTSFKSRIFTS